MDMPYINKYVKVYFVEICVKLEG